MLNLIQGVPELFVFFAIIPNVFHCFVGFVEKNFLQKRGTFFSFLCIHKSPLFELCFHSFQFHLLSNLNNSFKFWQVSPDDVLVKRNWLALEVLSWIISNQNSCNHKISCRSRNNVLAFFRNTRIFYQRSEVSLVVAVKKVVISKTIVTKTYSFLNVIVGFLWRVTSLLSNCLTPSNIPSSNVLIIISISSILFLLLKLDSQCSQNRSAIKTESKTLWILDWMAVPLDLVSLFFSSKIVFSLSTWTNTSA